MEAVPPPELVPLANVLPSEPLLLMGAGPVPVPVVLRSGPATIGFLERMNGPTVLTQPSGVMARTACSSAVAV